MWTLNPITSVLSRDTKENRDIGRGWCDHEGREAATSQGPPEATRSWKRQEGTPWLHLDFGLLASRTLREYISVVFLATRFVVICYSSKRDLIQRPMLVCKQTKEVRSNGIREKGWDLWSFWERRKKSGVSPTPPAHDPFCLKWFNCSTLPQRSSSWQGLPPQQTPPVSSWGASHFFFFFPLTSLLEYNCFTMVC